MVIGLCLLMGYAGQVSLGHAGFFAIGGYTSAVLTTLQPGRGGARRAIAGAAAGAPGRAAGPLRQNLLLAVSPWAALLAALLAAGLIALLIGLPVIRLKGHYLAMATLGFGLIIYRVVLGTPSSGQADGISNVPALPLFGGCRSTAARPSACRTTTSPGRLVLAAMVLAVNLVHSRVGRALRSIHESEEAAHSLGVDTYSLQAGHLHRSAPCSPAVGGALPDPLQRRASAPPRPPS